MNVRIVTASAALLMIAGSASAADIVAEQPPAPVEQAAPLFTWNGFYTGIQGGGAWGNGDFSGIGSSSMNGGLVTGFAGYNWQLDNSIVLGLEGDVSYNWNSEDVGPNSYKFDTTGSVRARVGYALDRALLYGAAGWTGARGSVDTPVGSDSATFSGWTVGAGVDYAFTDNVFGRVEYRYNDYGSKDLLGVDTDFNQNVVTVGVGIKF
ncbi:MULTISPECIES: outer membrane protein [Rhizobium]|jgi:outer membrane immunogenic protein|uniref:Outer membrane immunogenic protein n=1 Tax=Rhizobium metallidurans TaxID=1265931 RepID=A0A7W6CPP4_9HYPH|nr:MULTISPECIES: outer membrane protein [Rhizobium]MBB3964905.1 outer membrane immunogenic protein [Rhizobium metallidurans]